MMLRPQPTVTARTSRRMIPGYLLRPVMVSPVPRLRGRSVQAVSGVAAVPDQVKTANSV